MKDKRSIIIQSAIRILGGGLLMLLLAQLMMLDASRTGQELKFMESTYTEWAQQIILLSMTAIFGHCAYHFKDLRGVSLLLGGVSLAGLVREYNNFFNEQVFDGAWQTLVLLVVVLTGLLIKKYGKSFWLGVEKFYQTLSFGFLLAGFLTTFVFSRLFGKTSFWEAVMEEKYFRSVKNAAEECTELLGYGLLFIAAVEYFFLIRSIHQKMKPGAVEW